MRKMRAVRLLAPGRVELESVAEPRPGPDEVLVAVDACGICGSDVHIADGVTVAAYHPMTLGHEAAGVVAEVGPGVAGATAGDRVAILPYVGCDRCGRCAVGQQQACARRAVLGVDIPGAHADLVVVPAGCLVPLPAEVPAELGAILTDAVATPFHAIRRSGVSAGETAAVFGLGGLGMHAVQLLAALGCTVFAVDPRAQARRRAEELGAALTLDAGRQAAAVVAEETAGGADAAFEFVGHPDVVGTALRSLRPQGTCVVVGITPDRLAVGMRQETLVGRELRLVGSFGATAAELGELVGMVADGTLDLSGSVSAVHRPERFADALAETREKRSGSVRVVVSYR